MAAMASSVLYWFSGSGNSLVVATALSEALGGVPLVPVVQALRLPAAKPAGVMGVVFPVYAFGLPNIVRRFLETVPLEADPYVFTVATPGVIPGNVHREAEAVLGQRGVALAAGWTVLMPESFSPLRLRLTVHRTATVLRRVNGRVADIAGAVSEGRRGVRQDSLAPTAWAGAAVHRAAARFFPTAGSGFRVAEHCAACGLCARVCPVGNISVDNGKPAWGERCEWCFACMQWCPVGAIETTGLATNRLRYHHPAVTAEQIAAQTVSDDPPPPAETPADAPRGASTSRPPH
jgi:ferredoxin